MPWKSGLPVLVMGVVLALTPSYRWRLSTLRGTTPRPGGVPLEAFAEPPPGGSGSVGELYNDFDFSLRDVLLRRVRFIC